MTTIQTSASLYQDLGAIGLELPEYADKIKIIALGFGRPVRVVTESQSWSNAAVQKHAYDLVDADGQLLMSEDFYKMVKDVMQLPDETSKIEIVLMKDSVATTILECATPTGSLSFLEGYKLS